MLPWDRKDSFIKSSPFYKLKRVFFFCPKILNRYDREYENNTGEIYNRCRR